MKQVDVTKVFAPSKVKSPFKTAMNPTRVCLETMEQIESISEMQDMAKAEVVRYALEFALLNADWFEASHQKRRFKGEVV